MAQIEIDSRGQRAFPRGVFVVMCVATGLRIVMAWAGKDISVVAVRWSNDKAAHGTSAETRKPILYEFSAAWCGPCRQLEQEVFADPEVARQINDAFVPVRLLDRVQEDGRNTGNVARLELLYGVRRFPAMVVVDSRDRVLARIDGYDGRDASRTRILEYAAKYRLASSREGAK